MLKIAFFCIPAHGHTNPTLAVVRALRAAGHEVDYFSFEPHRAAIEAAGARFIPCDGYDVDIHGDGAAAARDITVSTSLIVQTTLAMDEDVTCRLKEWKPDVIVADSVAFWGRLFALKLGIPCVCSCTTFAFNRYSSRIMKQSLADLPKLLIGLLKTRRLLKPLRDKGYPANDILSIVQNDGSVPTVVYTSREFQPFAETFSDAFTFVGPCLRPAGEAVEKGERPLVYVSMGTVIGGEAAFYRSCIQAFGDGRYDVILSVGAGTDPSALGPLPENVKAFPSVDQIAVLQAADVFVTHCGMNSVSEALYFGVPLVMRPLTPEEDGVANRVEALGAGLRLKDCGADAIRRAVDEALSSPEYRAGAERIGQSFRRCGGAEAAARAIERAARPAG